MVGQWRPIMVFVLTLAVLVAATNRGEPSDQNR